MRPDAGKNCQRIYRRMTGVRGIPPHHHVVLCGIERGGCMATASGVDFEEAKAAVDWKLDELHRHTASAGSDGAPPPWPGAAVKVNELDATGLARAAGISDDLAAAVVSYRQEHGGFTCGPDIGCVPHADRAGLMRLAIVADYGNGHDGVAAHLQDAAGETT
jgi:DNA uptake protein ComE-like DNA-binding protein